MILTLAQLSDAPGIARLVNGAYRGPHAEAGWANEAGLLDGQRTDEAQLRAALAGPATVLLLRELEGGPLAGCVSVEPAEGSTWFLGMLTIDPHRQADGLGRRLLEAGEHYARDRGASTIRMTVIWLRYTLIAWYERRGYRLTGATKPFLYEDRRFGLPLRDDLHFVVMERTLGPTPAPEPA